MLAQTTVPVMVEGLDDPIAVLVIPPPAMVTLDPKLTVLVAVRVVKVAAAQVDAPITTLSIVPASIFAVSATSASILAVPSINKSLNCCPLAPKSISSSVVGSIAPSVIFTCSVDVLDTSTNILIVLSVVHIHTLFFASVSPIIGT